MDDGEIFTPGKFFTGDLINNIRSYYIMNKNDNELIDMAEADELSAIAEGNNRPNRIPENWVVNPHNNIDPKFADKAHVRENWISPEALEKICPGCTHTRMTNAYYVQNLNSQIHNQ